MSKHDEWLKKMHEFYDHLDDPCARVIQKVADAMDISEEEAKQMDNDYHTNNRRNI